MRIGNGFETGLTVCALATGSGAGDDEAEPANELETEAARSAVPLGSNALTKPQAATVLELLDDTCADSWCEGDHNFHFDGIRCQPGSGADHPGTCELSFRIVPHDRERETGPTYARSCETSGFAGFSSLVDTAPNGYQSIRWDYYAALDECIWDAERKLAPR